MTCKCLISLFVNEESGLKQKIKWQVGIFMEISLFVNEESGLKHKFEVTVARCCYFSLRK